MTLFHDVFGGDTSIGFNKKTYQPSWKEIKEMYYKLRPWRCCLCWRCWRWRRTWCWHWRRTWAKQRWCTNDAGKGKTKISDDYSPGPIDLD